MFFVISLPYFSSYKVRACKWQCIKKQVRRHENSSCLVWVEVLICGLKRHRIVQAARWLEMPLGVGQMLRIKS